MKIILAVLISLLIATPGCKQKDTLPENKSRVNQYKEQKSKAPSFDEVQAFLKKWSELQSNRDVSGYLALYSTDFTGVKRTASGKTTTYNFQKWAEDRGKMYQKAKSLSVVAEEVKISGTDETTGITTVEFMQYYTSEKYSDKGRKIIKMQREGSDIKIIFEELLFSQQTANESNQNNLPSKEPLAKPYTGC